MKFCNTDFAALYDGALLSLLSRVPLSELIINDSVVPAVMINDAVVRQCLASGVTSLKIGYFAKIEVVRGKFFDVSEEAILDYCFPTSEQHRGKQRSVQLEDIRVSDTFLSRFIEVCASLDLTGSSPSQFLISLAPPVELSLDQLKQWRHFALRFDFSVLLPLTASAVAAVGSTFAPVMTRSSSIATDTFLEKAEMWSSHAGPRIYFRRMTKRRSIASSSTNLNTVNIHSFAWCLKTYKRQT